MKKRFGLLEEKSSKKQDSSSNQDLSDKQKSSNKEDISNKPVRSRKQNSSRKQDSSIKLKNIDPDCLIEKNFLELYYSKKTSIEQSQAAREHAKEISAELLRVEAISKRQYNTLFEKCED